MVVTGDPLVVRVAGEDRPAWADVTLVGEVLEGDRVIVNVDARDLGLGSGGYDVVHVNLTRGLDARGPTEARAMKLNYTSLQHPVDPVEIPGDEGPAITRRIPVLVILLHGQLAPAAWAANQASPRIRVGFIQTAGGALPGGLSRDVAELRRRRLLCGHVTGGPTYGGEGEAITVIGALQAAAEKLEWDAVIAGPGPGIVGFGSRLGNGAIAAIDTAHASLMLGLDTLVAPRMSSGDPRPRHRGLSHHTETVLRMLLGDVRVPVPARQPVPWRRIGDDDVPARQLREACGERHEIWVRPAAVDEYAQSGLPRVTMGREIVDDRLFFATALAAGDGLAAATVHVGSPG